MAESKDYKIVSLWWKYLNLINFEMDRSNVRESYMKGSYVFNNTVNNVNRSFISTALIGDSLAYNDDLRK